jgi:hypothetical protein
MADGDDLPDGDYESIYGSEAMRARTTARLDAILRHLEALIQQPPRVVLPPVPPVTPSS